MPWSSCHGHRQGRGGSRYSESGGTCYLILNAAGKKGSDRLPPSRVSISIMNWRGSSGSISTYLIVTTRNSSPIDISDIFYLTSFPSPWWWCVADDPSQHPGSPGWPQQFCLLQIFIQLLRNTSLSFFPRGMGTDILVKKALTVGILTPPKNVSLIAHQRQSFAGVKMAPLLQKLFVYTTTVGLSMGGMYPM